MFSWIGLGAAIQNMIELATSIGCQTYIQYPSISTNDAPVAKLNFTLSVEKGNLANWIAKRTTNRKPFNSEPLNNSLIEELSNSIKDINANVSWTTSKSDYKAFANMDANLSYIRLEHKPFSDELFDILRFSKKDSENMRYGLSFESLGVPRALLFFVKALKNQRFNKVISKLGIGKLVARDLASKLCKSGAICLITAKQHSPQNYIEAGRAVERIWLAVTAKGLSVHPYGVLPQYITKSNREPNAFLPKHINIINEQRTLLYSIFPSVKHEFPALILRIGKSEKQSLRSDIRLSIKQLR
jgi:hypothetical protein